LEGTLSYTYDAAGHVASIASSNSNGASVSYDYDDLNRLSTVVDNRLGSTTSYTYDAANNLATVTYPNGVQTVFQYDTLSRVSGLAQQQGTNQAPQYSAQSWASAVATAQTTQHVGEVVYQETRPMSDSGKANVPLTTAREMIADVYLNGNHIMAPGTNKTKSGQEKAALSDSLQAASNAVMNRQFHNDITGGAKKYNQSPNDHSGSPGGGAFCPNSCPIKGSYGPYVNANPSVPVERYINIYN
jgi:YD repeat-containing protein